MITGYKNKRFYRYNNKDIYPVKHICAECGDKVYTGTKPNRSTPHIGLCDFCLRIAYVVPADDYCQ